jgi:putative flippase GtrA
VVSSQDKARVIRSAASGIAAGVFDFAVLVALVELAGLDCAIAAALAALVGAIVCFAMNRWWAFRDPRPLSLAQVGAFVVVAVGGAAITAGVVHVLASVLRLAYLLAKAVSAGVVFLAWSYPAQSRLVFATRSNQP